MMPLYESNQNIDARPVAPELHMAGQREKAISGMVDTVQDLTDHLSKVNDVMQETKAKTDIEMALVQKEQAAQLDPNADNVEEHLKGIQDLTKNATKGIDNQELAARVGAEIHQTAFLSGIKIQDMFKKKQMFANDMKLDQLATTTAYNKANAVSEAAGLQDEANFMDTITQNVNSGLISQARAEQLVRSYKLGVVKNDINKDPATNLSDSPLYKDINSNKYGLDLKETETATNMLKTKIKENKEIDIKNVIQNRIDLIGKIASNEVNWRDADQISKIAQKDMKLGEALNNVFKADSQWPPKEYKSDEEQNQYFSELIKNIFAKDTKEELSNHLTKLLDENASRNISKDRLSILINAASQRAKGLSTTKASGDGFLDQVQRKIGDLTKSISDFFKGKKDGGVQKDFHANIKNGMEPDQAKQKAMNDYNVKSFKWVATLPSEGKIMVDKNGNKLRWFPDGHNEVVK